MGFPLLAQILVNLLSAESGFDPARSVEKILHGLVVPEKEILAVLITVFGSGQSICTVKVKRIQRVTVHSMAVLSYVDQHFFPIVQIHTQVEVNIC